MPKRTAKRATHLKTLQRAFQMLRLFDTKRVSASLSELIRLMSSNKPTTFRLATTLEHLGLLQRRPDGRFALGPAVLDLRAAYISANPLRARALEIVDTLTHETGATVQICSLVGRQIVPLIGAEARGQIRAAAQIGEPLPLHATASGKAIAADLADTELEDLLGAISFRQLTLKTVSSRKQFKAEIALTRERGFALAIDELAEGLSSVGVGLGRNLFQRPSALVALLPTSLVAAEDLARIAKALRAARNSLTID